MESTATRAKWRVISSRQRSCNYLLYFSSRTTSPIARSHRATPLRIDGDLDADIVFHEYGHDLTWRKIGGVIGKIAGANWRNTSYLRVS